MFASRLFKAPLLVGVVVLLSMTAVLATDPPGEEPRLGYDRITQDDITDGSMTLLEIRKAGRTVFSTPFNKLDGYGDGPINPADTTSPGGRPTLQNNGTYLRVNGLDGQTCVECHSVLSNATVPFTFGVGGVGGSATNAIAGATYIDVADDDGVGFATYNGRFINPPFLFGAGGVELLGKEMTTKLQALKQEAIDNQGQVITLKAKGVDFGTISYDGVNFDTSNVEGVSDDLVVRPFGRKGEFISTREFDIGALGFHFGMQAAEAVGEGVDADGDGVVNEIMEGELSALAIFNTTMERPRVKKLATSDAGFDIFESIGCDVCHVPKLNTESVWLTHASPEVGEDPSANVYYQLDLTRDPTEFKPNHQGGVKVRLFADLKRHDMGPALAESTGSPEAANFTTARLWGVADTAPYLHDGRAQTLTDAILMHGGEGQEARDNFDALSNNDKIKLLSFLRSLRTPKRVGADLD